MIGLVAISNAQIARGRLLRKHIDFNMEFVKQVPTKYQGNSY